MYLTLAMTFRFQTRSKYVKKVVEYIDKNKDRKIRFKEFERFFARYLKRKSLCGKPPRKQVCKRVKTTSRTVVRGFRVLYCVYKRRYGRLSVKTFLTKYYKRASGKSFFPTKALRDNLIRALPRKARKIRQKLQKIK